VAIQTRLTRLEHAAHAGRPVIGITELIIATLHDDPEVRARATAQMEGRELAPELAAFFESLTEGGEHGDKTAGGSSV